MLRFGLAILVVVTAAAVPASGNELAPGGTLRAVYLATNPAQAVQDRTTGAIRGASADLARELAGRLGTPLDMRPVANPPAVIEAVQGGAADIGFVAYEATRLGTVDFSQTYMLVRQSFLVHEGSPIRVIADVDRAGQKIAGTRNDSITLCMRRTLKHATLIELQNNAAEISRALSAREIDAVGANRQRLTFLMRDTPGSRLLPDNLFNVPQNIIVPMGRPAALATLNRFIDDVRASGFLASAIEKSGITGIEAAPAGPERHGCPG